jgi:hypothetical protein
MPSTGFELAIPTITQLQAYVLACTDIRTATHFNLYTPNVYYS